MHLFGFGVKEKGNACFHCSCATYQDTPQGNGSLDVPLGTSGASKYILSDQDRNSEDWILLAKDSTVEWSLCFRRGGVGHDRVEKDTPGTRSPYSPTSNPPMSLQEHGSSQASQVTLCAPHSEIVRGTPDHRTFFVRDGFVPCGRCCLCSPLLHNVRSVDQNHITEWNHESCVCERVSCGEQ